MSKISINTVPECGFKGSEVVNKIFPTDAQISEALEIYLMTLRGIKDLGELVEVTRISFLQPGGCIKGSGWCPIELLPWLETHFEMIFVNPINKEKISVETSVSNAREKGSRLNTIGAALSFKKKILERIDLEIKSARLAANHLEDMLPPR